MSQKEIAQRLGVSQATVSLALNGHPRITEAMRERVVAVAEELGYRPNPVRAQMARQRFHGSTASMRETLAFVSEASLRPARLRFEVAREHARKQGYELEFFDYTEDGGVSPERLRSILDARGIRGCILEARVPREHVAAIDTEDKVVVHLGLVWDEYHKSAVHLDHFLAIQVAFQEAARVGFGRVAYVNPGTNEPDRRFRQAALGLQRLVDMEIAAGERPAESPKIVYVLRRSYDPRLPVLEEDLASMLKARPDCIIATGSWIRARLMQRFPGRSIPPVALIFPSAHRNEEFAGFDFGQSIIAESAIELLHRRLMDNDYGKPRLPRTINVLPDWIDHPTFRPSRR